MKAFYKFFKGLMAILLLVAIVVISGFACHVDRKSIYYTMIFKRHLLQTVKTPRIIFVGGSNVRFGIVSQMFKDSLKLNPINTALTVGFGLKLTISNIKPYLKKGDIVVIVPEYLEFYGDAVWGNNLVANEVNIYPEDIETLNLHQLKPMLTFLPQYNLRKLAEVPRRLFGHPTPIPIYESSDGVNQYGDTQVHWGMPPMHLLKEEMKGEYNPEALNEIQSLSDYVVNDLKGKLFLAYPSFAKSSYLTNKEKVERVQEVCSKSKIIVLGQVKDFVYEDSLFFNTEYHLNKTGGIMRSLALIKDIKPYLK